HDNGLHRRDHLQWSDGDIALSESRVIGITGRPVLPVVDTFPVTVWHTSGDFPRKLDPQFRADAQCVGITDQIIDTEAAGTQARLRYVGITAANLIEIHVTAL